MNWILLIFIFTVTFFAVWLYYESHGWNGAFFALITCPTIMVGTYYVLQLSHYEAADILSIALGAAFCLFSKKREETEEVLIQKKQEVDIYT